MDKLFRQNICNCRATLGSLFQQPIHEARHCLDVLVFEGGGLCEAGWAFKSIDLDNAQCVRPPDLVFRRDARRRALDDLFRKLVEAARFKRDTEREHFEQEDARRPHVCNGRKSRGEKKGHALRD